MSQIIAETIEALTQEAGNLTVSLSNELVQLLSDQLYQSPLKAVEELVVNAYDADATECRLFVPAPSDTEHRFVIVYDNGFGMSYEGLVNLWHIGRSPKSDDRISERMNRKQIGKFGIGKLATYTIANELTYITKHSGNVLSVALNYNRFQPDATGASDPIVLKVKRIDDVTALSGNTAFQEMCRLACLNLETIFTDKIPSWTIAILEDLKPKSTKITLGNLGWVLRTAMPLKDSFKLYLNCDEIISSKEDVTKLVEFTVAELPNKRIEALTKSTGEKWYVSDGRLKSDTFAEGILGTVFVSQQTLKGKSADLGRSLGFFVKVRDRLINSEDALFGLHPLSFEAFNRFRADVQANDLDTAVTAPREGVEASKVKNLFQDVLLELFNEARQRYQDHGKSVDQKDVHKGEEKRSFVNQRLVEYPVADVLATQPYVEDVNKEEDKFFYIEIDPSTDINAAIVKLYGDKADDGVQRRYRYEHVQGGTSARMVSFDPTKSTFTINLDHDFVKANYDDGRSKALLQDVVTAEALLEVYLRESHVSGNVINEVLERRDVLLRSLANDHPYSLELISASIRDAASDERALEVALVAAARALGFVANQVSGSGQPDGIAYITQYPGGVRKIILEAKASTETPALTNIDFAGLHEHMRDHKAEGCLLVAPSYPGTSRQEYSATAKRARQQGISCWTVEQLANFVAAAEARQLTAQDVLQVVTNKFSPGQVRSAIKRLLLQPAWDQRGLYKAILEALKQLEGRLKDRPRTADMVAGEVSRQPGFVDIRADQVEDALKDLASASQKGLVFRDGVLIITVSIDEIERRLNGVTGYTGGPRRSGNFR